MFELLNKGEIYKMGCEFCIDLGNYKCMYSEQIAADNFYEIGVPMNYCPNCGKQFNGKEEVFKMNNVNHPKHYGGDTVYEAIKVIDAWNLGFCLGNTLKYICRYKEKGVIEDLKKAVWYLNHEIEQMETKAKIPNSGVIILNEDY